MAGVVPPVREERDRLVRILRDLPMLHGLPLGQWTLNGSAVMVLHGIQREKPMGDVDVFVATRVWFEMLGHRSAASPWEVFTTEPDDPKRRADPPYLFRDMHGLEVNIFSGWRRRGIGDIDVNMILHNAELVQGWPCVPLYLLRDWKQEVGRGKDADDIRLISEFLERGAPF